MEHGVQGGTNKTKVDENKEITDKIISDTIKVKSETQGFTSESQDHDTVKIRSEKAGNIS